MANSLRFAIFHASAQMQGNRSVLDIAEKLYGFSVRQVVTNMAIQSQYFIPCAQTAIFGGLSPGQYRLYEDTYKKN